MRYKLGILLIVFLFINEQKVLAQDFFRIKADISIKLKTADGNEQLTMGTVYYDKNYRKVVYDITFPVKQVLVIQDTSMYDIRDGKVMDTIRTVMLAEFTLFHLALNNNMKDYGLKNTLYAVEKVEREGELVISTWAPQNDKTGVFGNIIIANKNRQLNGIVFFNAQEEIISKQFFEDFILANGLNFPQKIVQFSYNPDGSKNIQVTTFKNIEVNDVQASFFYNHPLR